MENIEKPASESLEDILNPDSEPDLREILKINSSQNQNINMFGAMNKKINGVSPNFYEFSGQAAPEINDFFEGMYTLVSYFRSGKSMIRFTSYLELFLNRFDELAKNVTNKESIENIGAGEFLRNLNFINFLEKELFSNRNNEEEFDYCDRVITRYGGQYTNFMEPIISNKNTEITRFSYYVERDKYFPFGLFGYIKDIKSSTNLIDVQLESIPQKVLRDGVKSELLDKYFSLGNVKYNPKELRVIQMTPNNYPIVLSNLIQLNNKLKELNEKFNPKKKDNCVILPK